MVSLMMIKICHGVQTIYSWQKKTIVYTQLNMAFVHQWPEPIYNNIYYQATSVILTYCWFLSVIMWCYVDITDPALINSRKNYYRLYVMLEMDFSWHLESQTWYARMTIKLQLLLLC
jgi:hypothetical protein